MLPSATTPGTELSEAAEDVGTVDRRRTVGRLAADRAAFLRQWVDDARPGSMEPLAAALRRRAGELELVAAAMADAPSATDTAPARHIAHIA